MSIKARGLVLLLVAAFCFSLPGSALNNSSDQQALDAKQESLVAISSYTAQGKMPELSKALNEGLDAGLTINEIKEALVQLYAYCGFPRSLNGVGAFMKVLNDRKEQGIVDEQGKEIEMHSQDGDRYERGRKVLEVLTKTHQPKPAPGFGEFVPREDAFLKEHLFADIFESDVLSYYQRELVTIAALASMESVGPQLAAHVSFGMNVGITEAQLEDLFDVIEVAVGKTEAEAGLKITQSVIERRNK